LSPPINITTKRRKIKSKEKYERKVKPITLQYKKGKERKLLVTSHQYNQVWEGYTLFASIISL